MSCGCGARARAAAKGQKITGYRITATDGSSVPPLDQPPYFSLPEAKSKLRTLGGGTVRTEFRPG